MLDAAFPFPRTARVPTSATGPRDVILGDTGPYATTPGFDHATGLAPSTSPW